MVSRLGDCEALVRTAAKESLAKAGEGSQPSPGGVKLKAFAALP